MKRQQCDCAVREMASMDDQGLVVVLPRKGGCS